jgi:tetratricopeptide (TPR) repeat protein
LFHLAAEMAAGERPAFLTDACQGDETLRAAVQELLDAADAVENSPAWNATALDNEAIASAAECDTDLERYHLSGRIGAGGMGVVYKAFRAGDFSKVVAIKIVHEADPAIVALFLQERQILARLEHPHIARLLDGGSTPDGLPFLVMEFVDGVPIDRYVSERKLSRRELLELFRKICAAVFYAHGQLVLHRDLKPANILVTQDGQPKLLDFGVAKCLDGSGVRTRTGAGAMTPEYASPEQVQGAPIGTASDIYSLGVLLYELLTGVGPYRETGSAMDLAREICSGVPESLAARSGRSFDADLERIVQMALRKEPARRYASVEQFSEDIRRYLEGYPVLARPATRRYLVAKFVGRNKTAILAAVLVLMTLGGGVAATVWEARAANRRFNDARKLANSYLFEFYDGIRDLPGATPVRQLVVKRALEYLDSLAAERGGDVALGRELATAYVRVGDVEGAPNWASLGDRPGALASYRKALAVRQRLAAASPDNVDLDSDLSESYSRISNMLTVAGDLSGSAENGRRAVALMEKVVARKPADAKVRNDLANTYVSLGDVLGNNDLPNLGDPKGALELYRKAVAIREKLVAEDPSNQDRRMWLQVGYAKTASVLQSLGDKEGSIAAYVKCLDGAEELLRQQPLNVLHRKDAAIVNRSLSLLLIRTGALEEARTRGDRSAQLFGELATADPGDVQAQQELADSRWSQGYVLAKLKDVHGAFEHYDSAIALYQKVIAAHPGIAPAGLRTAFQLKADLANQTGDTAKALASARNEIEIDGRLLAANSANVGALHNLGVAYLQTGQAHETLALRASLPASTRKAEWIEARSWFQRSLSLWVDLRDKKTLIPAHAHRLDDAQREVEKADTALRTREFQ